MQCMLDATHTRADRALCHTHCTLSGIQDVCTHRASTRCQDLQNKEEGEGEVLRASPWELEKEIEKEKTVKEEKNE